MRRFVLWLPLLAMVAGCPVLSPRPAGKIQALRDEETGRRYHLYVPTYYTAEEDWPLLVTLQGTHLYDDSYRQVREVAYMADRMGFILVAPGLRSVQGTLPVEKRLWRRDLERDRTVVLSVVDAVSEEYNIDPECVALSGFSAGGYVMYDVGLRYPERFQFLLGRSASHSMMIFEGIEFTDAARDMPIHLVWGRDDIIREMAWESYEYLRTHGFFKTKKSRVEGGHWRHPEVVELWKRHWPPRHVSKPQRLGQRPP